MFNKVCKSSSLIGCKSTTRSRISIRSYTTEELRQKLNAGAKDFNITQMSDWYKITNKVFPCFPLLTIKQYHSLIGSSTFDKDFNSSPIQFLTSVYPDFNWLPWKFERCPRNFWDDISNQLKFIHWAANDLKIKEMSDWYNITNEVYFFSRQK